MNKSYELTTIKDIFDKVPIDRIETLFAELLVGMEQAAFVRGSASDDFVKSCVEFPSTITWVDDGKGDVSAHFHLKDDGPAFLTIKSEMVERSARMGARLTEHRFKLDAPGDLNAKNSSKPVDTKEEMGGDLNDSSSSYNRGYNQALADMRHWLACRYADRTLPESLHE